MMSLFSPFDMYWFFIPLSFSILTFYMSFSLVQKLCPLGLMVSELKSFLSEFFLSLKPKYFNKGSTLLFISVFFMLITINFLSVFSFNFPGTSQVSLVMSVAGTLWLSLILFSFLKNFKGFFSHLVPEGTPLPLTFLLFLIEMVSNLIRPLTLTVRLVANILAGHLLMSLLSGLVFSFNFAGVLYLLLNLVEIFVSLIQAYIFTTMVVLYFSEV